VRVHWLRARAQADRWCEERLLLTYEMQWTVKSFLKKSKTWRTHVSTGIGGSAPTHSTIAYTDRQATTWRAMAVLSDHEFKLSNPNYVSPL